ncbi:uncharacterized protein CIMG_12860 [Coccidioides immitis RS]|uniref:Uncharacterized protein n=1 Tax=Coccidioides immitis (strain RS) TaxID=246410 RepID=J3KHA1_COCIM|nr:uncharacterized protein CIMG_12860 [Coccidioides immitis RS]EAS35216.3 hypothetical protein CIMG_12860 [Coccidioides immitis RS]
MGSGPRRKGGTNGARWECQDISESGGIPRCMGGLFKQSKLGGETNEVSGNFIEEGQRAGENTTESQGSQVFQNSRRFSQRINIGKTLLIISDAMGGQPGCLQGQRKVALYLAGGKVMAFLANSWAERLGRTKTK